MIDINIIRTNRKLVEDNLKKKYQEAKLPILDEIIELDKKVRELKINGDNQRQERLKSNLCKWCYYMEADEVVMSAFTTQICKGCAKTNIYGNSTRHMYCEECSEKMHLCKHCGSVID